jgi:hypothetical protein
MDRTRRTAGRNPVYALLAGAILALLVMPLAIAGAADGPQASTSASAKQQIKKLKNRVTLLEGQVGEASPIGRAGGDLTGSYPNPTIGQNAVSSTEVTADSLTGLDIADSAIGAGELANNSVGTDELAGNVVGNSALKPVISRVSAGAESDNTFVEQTATCGIGEIMLGGGYAWTKDAGIDMVASAPGGAPGVENNSWFVRGRSTANDNGLFAWVTCLAL